MQRGGRDVSLRDRPLARLKHIQSPDDFLDYLESIAGDWLRVDTFARPQWWYLVDRSHTVRIKNLWLLDEQNKVIADFLRSHDIAAPEHLNPTRRTTTRLTAAQEARVRQLYAEDFQIYERLRIAVTSAP